MKVRIGKNIEFTWTLTYNNEVVDLSTHQVQVEITTPKRTKIVITPNVEGNVLTFDFKGKNIGAHYLTCYVDRYTLDETVCDYKDPFMLVEKSWMEEDSQDDDLQTEFIHLDGNVVAAYLYQAGENITIDGNVISATDTTYTAGDNITIENNVISSTGGGATYTASAPLSISNNNISIDLSDYATEQELVTMRTNINNKQNKYLQEQLDIDTDIRWSDFAPTTASVGPDILGPDWVGPGLGISQPIYMYAGTVVTQEGTSGTMVVRVVNGSDLSNGQACAVMWVTDGSSFTYTIQENGWYCVGRHGSLINYTNYVTTNISLETYIDNALKGKADRADLAAKQDRNIITTINYPVVGIGLFPEGNILVTTPSTTYQLATAIYCNAGDNITFINNNTAEMWYSADGFVAGNTTTLVERYDTVGSHTYTVANAGYYAFALIITIDSISVTGTTTVVNAIASKQDTLNAGNGISISGNTIASTVTYTYDSSTQTLNITTT